MLGESWELSKAQIERMGSQMVYLASVDQCVCETVIWSRSLVAQRVDPWHHTPRRSETIEFQQVRRCCYNKSGTHSSHQRSVLLSRKFQVDTV